MGVNQRNPSSGGKAAQNKLRNRRRVRLVRQMRQLNHAATETDDDHAALLDGLFVTCDCGQRRASGLSARCRRFEFRSYKLAETRLQLQRVQLSSCSMIDARRAVNGHGMPKPIRV